jgi:hypothetical protein
VVGRAVGSGCGVTAVRGRFAACVGALDVGRAVGCAAGRLGVGAACVDAAACRDGVDVNVARALADDVDGTEEVDGADEIGLGVGNCSGALDEGAALLGSSATGAACRLFAPARAMPTTTSAHPATVAAASEVLTTRPKPM